MVLARRSLLVSLLLLAVAAVPAAVAAPPTQQTFRPVPFAGKLDPKSEPQNPPADYAGLYPSFQWVDVGREALEPTMGIDKTGTAFYVAGTFDSTGAGSVTQLLRSTDGGKSFHTIEPATQFGTDPPRDLDPWVYTDPDTGRTFDIGLVGAGSYLSFSDDQGKTWRTTFAQDPGVNDHQSIVTAYPPPKNPRFAPLNPTYPKLVYYCVNQISKSSCSVSRDGGVNWIPTGGAAYAGVTENAPEGEFPVCSGLTGHIQADRQGRLFLPAGHCFNPYLAISEDGGETWRRSRVSRNIDAAVPHTEVATDRAGNLYYTWIDGIHHLPWLATSKDKGQTWSTPKMIAPPGVFGANLPTVVAGEAGRVAITFAGSTDKDETNTRRPWNSYVLYTTNALDDDALFLSVPVNQTGDPIHRGNCLGRCGGMFDFIDIQLSPSDGTIWATSSDSCTARAECNKRYDATTKEYPSNPATDRRGIAIHQNGGPKLVGPLPEPEQRAIAATLATPRAATTFVPVEPPRSGTAANSGTAVRRFSITCPALRRPRREGTGTRRATRSAPFRALICRKVRKVRKVGGVHRKSVLPQFHYDLTEPASVSIRIVRQGKARRGTRTVLRTSAGAGFNILRFTGRAGGLQLPAGRYRATLVAVDSRGKATAPRTLTFRIQ